MARRAPLLLLVLLFSLPASSYLQGPIANTPPMGWSTWCTESGILPCFDDFCNAAEILKVAQFMKDDGLLALGYDHILLDDCWAGYNRTADGKLTEDKSRFPNGMKNFTATLHRMGFKLGLYTDVGERTCRRHRLGAWPYYESDARTFALDWEVDYIKMDWCDRPPGNWTPQELYSNFSAALQATGREVFFSICEWGRDAPWEWAPKIANAWRTGRDHIPVWYLKNGTQDPGKSGGTSNVIQQMAGLSAYGGPQRFNDPDYLEIEPYNLFSRELETQLSFWALAAAPWVFADDPRKAHVSQYMRVRPLIAINQDPAVIPGDHRLGRVAQIWSRPLSGGRWAVVLYNANVYDWNASHDVTCPLNSTVLVGLKDSPAAKFSLHDVWRDVDLGIQMGSFKSKKLAPKESLLLLVTPLPEHGWE